MKEQLYSIPVNDAFASECECPLCAMRKELEDAAIDYTMGPSYMEDDNRAKTDELGFCQRHISMLYNQKNRLGMALIQNTHLNKTIKDLKKLSQTKPTSNSGLFKKGSKQTSVKEYIDKLESSCFICQRIDSVFNRYINTIFHLWKKDEEFKTKFKASRGFCTLHYGILFDESANYLKGAELDDFITCLNEIYFSNIERVNGDVDWFITKFDYRFDKEPWKNSKDALVRSIIKTNHTIL